MVKVEPLPASRARSKGLRRDSQTRASGPKGALGELVGAVITVPAYFDDAQRQATRMPRGWPASTFSGSSTSRPQRPLPMGLDNAAEGVYAVAIWVAEPSIFPSSSSPGRI